MLVLSQAKLVLLTHCIEEKTVRRQKFRINDGSAKTTAQTPKDDIGDARHRRQEYASVDSQVSNPHAEK
jgi:hypothetical protein